MADNGLVPFPDDVSGEFDKIKAFQQAVHQHLVDGVDFGKLPGMETPTLFKPGAEKIVKLLGLADTYEIIDRREDWPHETRAPFFRYMVRCRLSRIDGAVVGEGLGECNSLETHYRYRWLWERELPEGVNKDDLAQRPVRTGVQYRMDNPEPASLVNTLLKMAKKRAQVDAALGVGRLSNLFTQDLEDSIPVEFRVVEEAQAAGSAEEPGALEEPPPAQTADQVAAKAALTCPIHGKAWKKNRDGGEYHIIDGMEGADKFCKPGRRLQGVAGHGEAARRPLGHGCRRTGDGLARRAVGRHERGAGGGGLPALRFDQGGGLG